MDELVTKEQLYAEIVSTDPALFVSRHLFGPIPHVFKGDLNLWLDWKTKLASCLEVDSFEILLVGSSALGFSLNPTKNLAAFQPNSDIDVCVISNHHFEVAWRYLRQTRPSWLTLPLQTRAAISAHRKHFVFLGTIATEIILPLLPFGHQWQAGLDQLSKCEPTVGRDIKLRIYRDFEALRMYQIEGIKKARAEILDATAAIETISEED